MDTVAKWHQLRNNATLKTVPVKSKKEETGRGPVGLLIGEMLCEC